MVTVTMSVRSMSRAGSRRWLPAQFSRFPNEFDQLQQGRVPAMETATDAADVTPKV
jgi:hypothetical protein